MFDLISMAELTASSAVMVFFLSSALSQTMRQRGLVAAALTGWFGLVVAAGATGVFTAQTGIGVAGVGLGVVVPLCALGVLVLGSRRGRELVNRVPFAALIGVHALRVLGITFVLLYAMKRLPAPFAPVAGWGDVAVGLVAIPLALLLARSTDAIPKRLTFIWNALGLTDLIAAVTLGATSSPGPLRIFHGMPSSAIMGELPWVLIPCFLVPSLAFLHLCTFYRLRTMSAQDGQGEHRLSAAVTAL